MRRLALAALVLVLGCDDRPPAKYPPPPPTYPPPIPTPSAVPLAAAGSPGCGRPTLRSGVQRVQAAGQTRSFTLVVPDGYQPMATYPVVFALHGSGGSGAGARSSTDLERHAQGRAIFLYPDAGRSDWDLNAPADQNPDVAFFDAMLFTIHNGLCVDPRRVFVTGFSNGAYMANQLGCRRGERIRGVVTNAGGGPYEMNGGYDAQGHLVCPGKAVASLVIHGANDGAVLPSEGQKSTDHWSYANRCGGGTSPAWTSPCVTLQGCVQPVGTCRIPGLGHAVWAQAGLATWAFIDGLK